MKRFIQTPIVCLSVLILMFAAAGCSDSPTSSAAPENTTPIAIKFVTPAADEISGENMLEVSITSLENGRTYVLAINSPEAIVFPNRTFYILKGDIELPTGDIGEKVTYQLKATYLGLGEGPNVPSRDVSHLVTVNGMTPFYGDDQGMYFTVVCSGQIEMMPETDPNSPLLAGTKPWFGISPSWPGQFAGNTIKVIVEELVASSGGGSTWRPVFTSYDWTTHGVLPTYRFSKTVTYESGWNTTAQLRPTTGEKFVRAKVTVDYFGQSQTVTGQVLLSGGSEWPNPSADGYRIFRLTGGYDGKG